MLGVRVGGWGLKVGGWGLGVGGLGFGVFQAVHLSKPLHMMVSPHPHFVVGMPHLGQDLKRIRLYLPRRQRVRCGV